LKILVVAAHPDDEIIGMGGTLKKLIKKHEVNVLFLADGITARKKSGYVNSTEYEPSLTERKELEKEINIRKTHAKNALKLLGITKTKFLDFPDNELDLIPFLKIVKAVELEINKTKCEMIFTHHYNDLNIDHRLTYKATITAARPLPESRINSIMSFEAISSSDWNKPYQFNPNMFVDISKEIKWKIKALKEYKNEIKKFPHPRSVIAIDALSKRWGSLYGMKSAEAFEIIFKKIISF